MSETTETGGKEAVDIGLNAGRLLQVWWAFFWRAAIAGAVLGALAGFVAGVVMAIQKHPEYGALAGGIAGYVISIPVSMWAIYQAIRKAGYKRFRLVVVSNDETD